MNYEIEDFILALEESQKEITRHLHNLLISLPEVTVKIRYKIPFYYRKSWVCYLNPIRKDSVELVFIRGNELSNIQGILDQKGRRQVSGITFSDIKEIHGDSVLEIVHEALILEETIKYTSKRRQIR